MNRVIKKKLCEELMLIFFLLVLLVGIPIGLYFWTKNIFATLYHIPIIIVFFIIDEIRFRKWTGMKVRFFRDFVLMDIIFRRIATGNFFVADSRKFCDSSIMAREVGSGKTQVYVIDKKSDIDLQSQIIRMTYYKKSRFVKNYENAMKDHLPQNQN